MDSDAEDCYLTTTTSSRTCSFSTTMMMTLVCDNITRSPTVLGRRLSQTVHPVVRRQRLRTVNATAAHATVLTLPVNLVRFRRRHRRTAAAMRRRAAAVPGTGKGRRGPAIEVYLAGSATAAPSSRLTGPLDRRHIRRRRSRSLQVGPRTPAETNCCWPLLDRYRRRIGGPPEPTLHHYLHRGERHSRQTETIRPEWRIVVVY